LKPPVKRYPRYWSFAAVSLTAAFFLLNALWIPAKAEIAQILLEQAWQRTLAGEPAARPWPWADTRPLGLLGSTHLQQQQVILEGDSGRNLAFGPTALNGSLSGRDIVISGHRDTHFRFLARLRRGDVLSITTPSETRHYRVTWLDVVDSRERQWVPDPATSRLTLVTCYPFDAALAGGPLRYVVTALPLNTEKEPARIEPGV
jgi:sortase A